MPDVPLTTESVQQVKAGEFWGHRAFPSYSVAYRLDRRKASKSFNDLKAIAKRLTLSIQK